MKNLEILLLILCLLEVLMMLALSENCTVPQSAEAILEAKKDVIFVLEQTDDWTSSQFDTIKNFVKDVLFGLCLGSNAIRVGLMTYTTDTDVHLYLNNELNSNEIVSVVDEIQFSGSSVSMWNALKHVDRYLLTESNGDRPEVQDVVIVVSDANFFFSYFTNAQAQELKNQGVELYVVCLGHDPDVDQLSKIASDPDSKYLMCNNSLHFPGYLQLFKTMFFEDRKSVIEAASLNGYKYRFLNTKETFADADSYCRELKGSLTSLNDDEEKQYVTERVKALSYLAECSQWWIGLYGPASSIDYWIDGSVVNVSDFASPSEISNSSTAVVLNQNFNFQWEMKLMEAEYCSVCKIPTNYTNLVILTESYLITAGSQVKLAVLRNDTASDDVKIQVNGQEYCSLIVNLSVSAAERSSLPLSLFGLTDVVDTYFYGVFDIWFQTNGSYVLTASTSLYSSIPVVLKSAFESEVVANCLNALTINGTGQTLTDSPSFNINEAHIFTATVEGTCPALQMVSYTWTVYLSRYQNPNLCTSEDVYQVINIPSSSDSIPNDSDLHIAPQLLSAGYYKICVTLLTSYMSAPYNRLYCGNIKAIDAEASQAVATDLILSVSPNVASLLHNTGLPLVINASVSFDPNIGSSSVIRFTWTCAQRQEQCDFVEQMWPGSSLSRSVLQLPFSDAVLMVPGNSLTVDQQYAIKVQVSSVGFEAANASITVHATAPTSPQITIICRSGCGSKINPSHRIALEAVCENCNDTGLSVQLYEWSLFTSLQHSLVSPETFSESTTTGLHQSELSIKPYTLDSGQVYDVQLTATNSQGETGEALYIVEANSPPDVGSCDISPSSGQALLSEFTINCYNFTDPDLPFKYRVYLQKEGLDTLLYYGNEMTISHLTFPTGPSSSNFTHNISISVFDSYNTSTSVNIFVQVLPPQQGNESLSSVLHNLVQNMSTSLLNESDQELLRFAGNVANAINDDTDSSEDSVAKRTEVRVTLLTALSEVDVGDQDVLQQMTNIMGDLTTNTQEVNDTIQHLAVNVSSRLAEGLTAVAESDLSLAQTIAQKQLSNLESLVDVAIQKGMPVATENASETQNVSNSYIQGHASPVLAVYEKIGDALLTGIDFASEEPIKITAKTTSLVLTWSKKDENVTELSAKLQDSETEGRFNFPLKESLQSSGPTHGNVESVNFQVQVMSKNPYIWDETAENVNLPVVNVIMKNRKQTSERIVLKDLPQPAQITVAANLSSLAGASSGNDSFRLNLTVDDGVITSSRSSIIRIPANVTTLVRIQTLSSPLSLKVLTTTSTNISTENITSLGQDIPKPLSDGLQQDSNIILLPQTGNESYYSVRVMVKTGQGYGNKEGNFPSVDVMVETFSVACRYWDEDNNTWSETGCQVGPLTTLTQLHCLCNHLTVFSGGIFVAPNTVDPIADIKLFLTFFENPVVVSTVIAVWSVYGLILYWARRKDTLDLKKLGMTFLDDNNPSDKYIYLICIVTSWWPKAGTTSNVFIYLRSNCHQSATHRLGDTTRKLFSSGAENWFILTTPHQLGEMTSVVVWHDNQGKNPSWHLKEVIVRDIQKNEDWHCVYDDWLAVDMGHCMIKAEIPALAKHTMKSRRLYHFTLKTSQDFRNGHLWMSIFSKPAESQFTRAQRLTCGLTLVLTTMLASIMFHGIPTDDPEDQLQQSGLSLSLSGIVIGIQSGLMMFPVNMIIIQLFTRTAPKRTEGTYLLDNSASSEAGSEDLTEETEIVEEKGDGDVWNKHFSMQSFDNHSKKEILTVMSQNKKEVNSSVVVTQKNRNAAKTKRSPFRFPWWFLYIAWTISMLTCFICSFFIMLYGLKYGYQMSVDWLVSFFTAFVQSAFVTQPLKVVIVAVLLTQILRRPTEYNASGVTQLETVTTTRFVEHPGTSTNQEGARRCFTPPLSLDRTKEILWRINLDNRARAILSEIIMYFVFVMCVLLMIYGHRNIDRTYRVTEATENMFVKGGSKFSKVSTVDSLWKYLENTLINNLVSTDGEATSNQASYLLGKARLRQIRVKSGSCSVKLEKLVTTKCSPNFWSSAEDTGNYNGSWSTPISSSNSDSLSLYTYKSSFSLVTLPVMAVHATYPGGGFVQELPQHPNESLPALQNIQNMDWIDPNTRALFVEFNLYNPNVNLLTMVVLVFEFTNFGGVFPYYQIYTTNLYHYSGELQTFVAVCETVFLIFVLIFSYQEIHKFRRVSYRKYFEDTWSYVEVAILALSYTVFGLFIQRMLSVQYSLQQIRQAGESFVSFYPAIISDFMLQFVMAFLSVITILRFFKLLRFNHRMSLLTGTLKNAKNMIIPFSVNVMIYTIAFATVGVLVFASDIEQYKDFGTSLISLFNFALGASDYYGLEHANRIIGPLFFFAFSFLYQFCLILMFLTIVMDGYSSTVEHINSLETEVHMVDFMWKKLKLLTMTGEEKAKL